MDSIRFHDGSPFDVGFTAGFYFRDQHVPPTSPFRPSSRADLRWKKGFSEGCEANQVRLDILRSRSQQAVDHAHEVAMRARAIRALTASKRLGPSPE